MLPRLVRQISAYAIPFLLVCLPALPWGSQGHQIVAQIAARKLTPRAKQKIVALLRSDPNDELSLKQILGASGPPPAGALEKALKTISTWPDSMPGGKGPTGPWHFVDIGLFEGPSHISERCPDGDCVSQKIDDLVGNLKTGKDLVVLDHKTGKKFAVFTPPKELRFLVHFLGDIHQPLHCATNADAGGNCIKEKGYKLQFPELHAVWDTALVVENTNKHPANAGAIIHEFDGNFTVPAVNGPNAMAAESFELAKKVYHDGKPPIPVIDHFVADVSPKTCATNAPPEINAITLDARASYDNPATLKDVRTQLYKGGVRLAEILNSIFDHP